MSEKRKKPEKDEFEELDFLGYGMDKDDALDFVLPYQMLERKKKGIAVIVTIGADDPDDLLGRDVTEFAREKAEFLLQAPAELVDESEVDISGGQSVLPRKEFCFVKQTIRLF